MLTSYQLWPNSGLGMLKTETWYFWPGSTTTMLAENDHCKQNNIVRESTWLFWLITNCCYKQRRSALHKAIPPPKTGIPLWSRSTAFNTEHLPQSLIWYVYFLLEYGCTFHAHSNKQHWSRLGKMFWIGLNWEAAACISAVFIGFLKCNNVNSFIL